MATGNLWNPAMVFCYPIVVAPIYGGCVYLSFLRWVVVGNLRRPRNVARTPTEPHRTPRIAKIWELRLETGDLAILAWPFGPLRRRPHLRRVRVFSVSALGTGDNSAMGALQNDTQRPTQTH